MKTTSFSLFLILITTGCDTSLGTVSDARNMSKEGKYKQSIELLKVLAKSGDAAAQFDLANLYSFGSPLLPADKTKAEKLWSDSCHQKYYVSCTNLGQHYLHYEQYEKAESSLLKAGKNGDRLAAEHLSKLYSTQSWSGSSVAQADFWNDEANKLK